MSDRVMTTEQMRNLHSFAYAWRSMDDLENGDTDLSRNRELQATEFDTWLATIQAAAWQKGWSAGYDDGFLDADDGIEDFTPNPYRKEQTDESP